MVSVKVGVEIHIGNSHENMQVNVQYPYIAMSLDSYVPLTEPTINCVCNGE